MPLLLLVPLVVGGAWITAKAAKETEDALLKGAIIAGVAYVAWVNRGAIASLVKV
jgi:hypothetical protein